MGDELEKKDQKRHSILWTAWKVENLFQSYQLCPLFFVNIGVDKESRPEDFGLLDELLTVSIHTLLNIVEAKEALALKSLSLIIF